MCFIHSCKEQNKATPLNALGQPIVPEDFEPTRQMVQKYRKWFKRAMKDQMKLFQKHLSCMEPISFKHTDVDGKTKKEWLEPPKSLKSAYGQLSSYMDDFYYEGIALSKCKNLREYAQHLCQSMDEATIQHFEDILAKSQAETRARFGLNYYGH